MRNTLQEMFVASGGRPIQFFDSLVRQADSIPIVEGLVTVRFLSGDAHGHGIRLKAKRGWIELSDGSRSEVVDTWRSPDLPDEITYRVSSPSGSLSFWNVYKIVHSDGVVTEDMWTGNAGMVKVSEIQNKRTYACSPGGPDEFAPQRLIVEIEWKLRP
jgi:hypothetical protein